MALVILGHAQCVRPLRYAQQIVLANYSISDCQANLNRVCFDVSEERTAFTFTVTEFDSGG